MNNSNGVIDTGQGTSFWREDDLVVIVRSDQPICKVPLDDIREFVGCLNVSEQDVASTAIGMDKIS